MMYFIKLFVSQVFPQQLLGQVHQAKGESVQSVSVLVYVNDVLVWCKCYM